MLYNGSKTRDLPIVEMIRPKVSIGADLSKGDADHAKYGKLFTCPIGTCVADNGSDSMHCV